MGLFGIPSKKERKIKAQQIKNCNRILTDSLKIMMSTENIDTFLSRLNDAKGAILMAWSIAGENTKCMIQESTPKECMDSLERDSAEALNACIDRYMRKKTIKISELTKGRLQKAKGLELVVEEYAASMPPECIEHWKWSVKKLISKIEKLES